jgi:hypothetical protein
MCLCLLISLASYIYLASGIFRKDKQDFIQEAALTRSSTLSFDIHSLLEGVANKTQVLFPNLEEAQLQELIRQDRFTLAYYQIIKSKKKFPSEKYVNDFEIRDVHEYLLKIYSPRIADDPSLAGKRILTLPPRMLVDAAALQDNKTAVTSGTHLTGTPSLLFLSLDPRSSSEGVIYHVSLIDLDMVNQQFANDSLFKNSLWNFQGQPILKHGTLENSSALGRIIASHELTGVERLVDENDGTNKLMGFSKIKGMDLIITSVMDEKIAYKAERLLFKKSILYSLILFSLSLIGGLLIASGTSQRVIALQQALRQYLEKGQPVPLPVSGSDEASALTDGLNQFFSSIQESQRKITQQSVQQQLQEREREKVRILTRVLYPSPFADYPNAQIGAYYRPTVPYGGVWWHHYPTAKGLGLFLCEAEEKGMETMIGIAQIKATLQSLSTVELNPSQLLNLLQEVLNSSFHSGLKFRAFSCLFVAETRTLIFSSAGHQSPLLSSIASPLQLSGLVEDLGIPLGSPGKVQFTDRKIALSAGDNVLFCNQGFSLNLREDTNLPIGIKGILSNMFSANKKFNSTTDQLNLFSGQINKTLGSKEPLHDSLFIQLKIT